MKLLNEHGVTKAEKSVTRLYGLVIGVHDMVIARKGGHQHDERALRQMEIGDERVHRTELIAGIDEDIRPGALFRERAVRLGQRFQRPAGCRADADDACG